MTELVLHEIPLGPLSEVPYPETRHYAEECLEAPDPAGWAERRAERAERDARRAFTTWKQTPYAKRAKRTVRASKARQLVLLALYFEALAEELIVDEHDPLGVGVVDVDPGDGDLRPAEPPAASSV